MIREFSRTGLPVWQQLLIDAWPSIYRDTDPKLMNYPLYASVDPRDRCNLRFGFECRGGWHGCLERFSKTTAAMVSELKSSGLQADARIHSNIVKEKLGALVFGASHNLREPWASLFRSHVAHLREQSLHTCEKCGRPGKLRRIASIWVVYCEDHYHVALYRIAGKHDRPEN